MRMIAELMNLRGRTALITGATGGIGQEIALTIAELGGNLILVDRPKSNYDQIERNILDNWNVDIKCIDCDLENHNSRINLIEEIVKNNVNLDI